MINLKIAHVPLEQLKALGAIKTTVFFGSANVPPIIDEPNRKEYDLSKDGWYWKYGEAMTDTGLWKGTVAFGPFESRADALRAAAEYEDSEGPRM